VWVCDFCDAKKVADVKFNRRIVIGNSRFYLQMAEEEATREGWP